MGSLWGGPCQWRQDPPSLGTRAAICTWRPATSDPDCLHAFNKHCGVLALGLSPSGHRKCSNSPYPHGAHFRRGWQTCEKHVRRRKCSQESGTGSAAGRGCIFINRVIRDGLDAEVVFGQMDTYRMLRRVGCVEAGGVPGRCTANVNTPVFSRSCSGG